MRVPTLKFRCGLKLVPVTRLLGAAALALVLDAGSACAADPRKITLPPLDPIRGPLVVSSENPRYFAGTDGKAVYLTGSHTWANLVDMGPTDPPPPFDFDAYLEFLGEHHHNYIRLWSWEMSKWQYPKGALQFTSPMPWQRTGPGLAADGKPRFNLQLANPAYFERLRDRVVAAGKRGIYVGIVLFEGNELFMALAPEEGHPFSLRNNINGLDADPEKTGSYINIHTLKRPEITRVQEAYVRWVIDQVNDLDNVIYEIANESGVYSREWQYHMVNFVKDYERTKPRQHPVGLSFFHSKVGGSGPNSLLFNSPADWISPGREGGREGGYRRDPPESDGKKVILADSDHFFGIGGDIAWVWKTVCRGSNPVFMDPYREREKPDAPPYPESSFSDHFNSRTDLDMRWEGIRRNLGYALAYAQRMNLNKARPDSIRAYSGYCLSTGTEFLIYLPDGKSTLVDLADVDGRLDVEWLDPKSGLVHEGDVVAGGGTRRFEAPFPGQAVLFLHSR